MTPASANAVSTGERLTREIKRAQASLMKEAAAPPVMDVWNDGPGSFASAPLVMMGNAKAASQTYNAGTLFTSAAKS